MEIPWLIAAVVGILFIIWSGFHLLPKFAKLLRVALKLQSNLEISGREKPEK